MMDAIEATRRHSNLDDVVAYFERYPMIWLDSQLLETVGGRMAWRTRVSECRTKRGMCIQNRQHRVMAANGRDVARIISEYRFLPQAPIGPDAGTARERTLFEGDPSGERR